jgi:endonuclease/exonuclease/phosphatase family metal-dependent hydrolase
MSARRTSPRLVAAVVASLAAALPLLSASPSASAAPPRPTPPAHAGRELTAASYNLFLGGDIGSLVRARTAQEFVVNAAALWQNVQATDFPARADAIAALLAEEHPDVVGLQEVATWEASSLTGSPVPSYDFLDILLDALAARGTPYRAVATNTNFVSPVVPVQPLGVALKYTDRDVVLVRAGSAGGAVHATNAQPHTFQAGIPVQLPAPLPAIRIVRGWSTVDVTVDGATVRFANTHLEAFSDVIRNLQAQELAASLAASPHPVVLAGDLNSEPRDETPEPDDVVAYETLTSIGLADAWTVAEGVAGGFTSGQTDPLTNVPSKIDHRIDYVLYDPAGSPTLRALDAEVLGEELDDRATSTVTGTPRLLWPSDHAGVVATLHVGRP